MKIPASRKVRLLACACIVAGVGAIATAVQASIPDASGVIHGCYSDRGASGRNGTQLNIVDSATSGCSGGQTEIQWNQSGPPGPPGVVNAYSVHTTTDIDTESSLTPIATLNVPAAGNYFFLTTVSMDLLITNPFDITETCEVQFNAGSLSDVATGFPVINHLQPGSATIQAFESFPSAGTATLLCMGPSAVAFHARITALQVTNFTDTATP
jgi:hypothetical protein